MKNPITTISGVFLIVLSGLTLFSVISSEQAASLGDYAEVIIEAVTGIIALFAKDKDGGL